MRRLPESHSRQRILAYLVQHPEGVPMVELTQLIEHYYASLQARYTTLYDLEQRGWIIRSVLQETPRRAWVKLNWDDVDVVAAVSTLPVH